MDIYSLYFFEWVCCVPEKKVLLAFSLGLNWIYRLMSGALYQAGFFHIKLGVLCTYWGWFLETLCPLSVEKVSSRKLAPGPQRLRTAGLGCISVAGSRGGPRLESWRPARVSSAATARLDIPTYNPRRDSSSPSLSAAVMLLIFFSLICLFYFFFFFWSFYFVLGYRGLTMLW